MNYFQFAYHSIVLEAFKMAIDAIKKDLAENTKTADVKITSALTGDNIDPVLQKSGTIRLKVKAELDDTKVSFVADINRDNISNKVEKARALCPTFFAREIMQVIVYKLEVHNKEHSGVHELKGAFSGFSDSLIRNLAYELIRLAYLQKLGKEMPKCLLLLNKFRLVRRNGISFFAENDYFYSIIYDQFGNILTPDNSDYDEVYNLFNHKIDEHRTFCGYREYDGFAILGFNEGYHIEADGFNAAENMW